jgi:16S rRNA (cytidine1402-2'-O)-methyltransferase
VVGGADPATHDVDPADLAAAVHALETEPGQTRRSAISEIARRHGVPKRQVFDAVVAAKADNSQTPRH